MSECKAKNGSVVPLRGKIAFGAGGAADNLMQNSINAMASQIFNIFLGVNPILISLVIFCSRIWDAFTDPMMGSISDNTRSRFGRRRPYIFAGGVLGSLLYILIWRMPQGWSQTAYFFWFLIGSILFYTAYTIFSVPYYSLGCELSSDYNERTKIMAFRTFFAAGIGLSMHWVYRLTQMDCFENTLDGMRTVSLGIAVMIAVTAIIPALACKERLQKTVQNQEKIRLMESLKVTLKNKAFREIILVVILVALGVFMVNQLGIYINIYHVFGGDKKVAATFMGFGGTLYGLMGGVIAAPLVSYISGRIGKKRTLQIGLSVAMVAVLSTFFTFNPVWPYAQFISLALLSPGLACLWILTPSMVADICDADEVETGVRREGMYSAVYSNVMKIGVSVGLLVTGLLLQASGFRAELGANQPEHTLLILRVLYAVIPFMALSGGLILIRRYPITREKADEIRNILNQRHAATENQSKAQPV